ncbi:MAG: hypothetical protein ACQESW_06915 [Bacteroidota bacterium]
MRKHKSKIHVVIISEHAWDSHPELAVQKLGTQISNRFSVLFINPPTSKFKYFSQKRRRYTYSENITLYTPFLLLAGFLSPGATIAAKFLQWITRKSTHKSLLNVIRDLSGQQLILINNSLWINPSNLNKQLRFNAVVFLLNAAFSWKQDKRKYWEPIVAACCRNADVVVTSNTFLKNYALYYTPNVYNIGEGSPYPPTALANTPAISFRTSHTSRMPVIGYMGTLHPHFIDIPLLLRLCQQTPEYRYLFITHDKYSPNSASLEAQDNVAIHYLEPENDGMRYLQETDVGLIPQASNYHTLVRFPNEILPFLALGKPVVAKRTINTQLYSTYIHLAFGDHEFLAAINRAVHSNSASERMERINFANRMSWKPISLHLFRCIYNSTGEVLLPADDTITD